MNRWKMKAMALLCALSVMPAAMPQGAGTAEWINLSSWSYAEVSGFVSEGLLPTRLENEGDFTRPITRGEFAELIYSVLESTGVFADSMYNSPEFSDCGDYPNINKLRLCSIAQGFGDNTFRPEGTITREDAAVFAARAVEQMGILPYVFDEESDTSVLDNIVDRDEISDYAADSVEELLENGMMSGGEDGRFLPKSELTIEQAVSIAYRIYKKIPRLISSDNEGYTGDTEQIIQSYENGLTETYYNETYYIKDVEKVLMEFESDVYSQILSCTYSNTRFVFAVNFNDKTDVYNADTGEHLYTIPYIVYKLDARDGYIYVYSARFMPVYSGIYNFEGSELIEPKYSEYEIKEICENGFNVPEDEYRTANGWIYYSDWNDNGHLYKIDSNGENKKLLVDGHDCSNTVYFNGMLYFNAEENGKVYCTDTEGNMVYEVSEAPGKLQWVEQSGFNEYTYTEKDIESNLYGNPTVTRSMGYNNDRFAADDGWVLYGEDADFDIYLTDSDGENEIYTIESYMLYMFRINNGTPERKQISDFPADDIRSSFSGDNRLFFVNEKEKQINGASPIYMYDGTETRCISGDLKAVTYGFMIKDYNDYEDPVYSDKIGFITPEEIGEGTYHLIDLDTGEITQKSLIDADEPVYVDDPGIYIYEEFSGNGYEVYKNENEDVCVKDENGNVTDLGYITPVYREGDIIYYGKFNFEDYGKDHDIVFWQGKYVAPTARYSLLKLNLKTGEKDIISDDFLHDRIIDDSIMMFSEGSGIYKKMCGDDALSVYPNNGSERYGEVYSIGYLQRRIWQPRYLYKFDKDGNITQLTDCHTEYWLYIPNGSDKATLMQYG